ncbi:MAG: GAF domain-containing protein, partial [Deltaproteobacteria bacterium]|nr:GAF domain-containing protein [Deltaproteobacteria bacterium]
MSSERALLAISRQAGWVPKDGQTVGSHALRVSRAGDLREAAALAVDHTWDVVAFDVACVRPPNGDDVLSCLRDVAPDATFLAVTGQPDVHEAIAFLKQGVYEYLEEPLSFEAFLASVAEAIDNRDAFREIQNLNLSLEAQREQLIREKAGLEKKNRELEAISLVARAVSSSLELEEILANLARCIQETFGFERILIGLLDSLRAWEKVQVVAGLPDSARDELRRKARWPLREGKRQPWIEAVLVRGEILRVLDPASHPLTAGTPLQELHRGPFVKIPMVAKGQIVGSITVDNPASGRPVDDDEMGVLTIFADSGAMAVDNARLYQTMKELSVRDE